MRGRVEGGDGGPRVRRRFVLVVAMVSFCSTCLRGSLWAQWLRDISCTRHKMTNKCDVSVLSCCNPFPPLLSPPPPSPPSRLKGELVVYCTQFPGQNAISLEEGDRTRISLCVFAWFFFIPVLFTCHTAFSPQYKILIKSDLPRGIGIKKLAKVSVVCVRYGGSSTLWSSSTLVLIKSFPDNKQLIYFNGCSVVNILLLYYTTSIRKFCCIFFFFAFLFLISFTHRSQLCLEGKNNS